MLQILEESLRCWKEHDFKIHAYMDLVCNSLAYGSVTSGKLLSIFHSWFHYPWKEDNNAPSKVIQPNHWQMNRYTKCGIGTQWNIIQPLKKRSFRHFHATIWMKLKDKTSEVSQSQTDKRCMIPHIWAI